MSTTRVEYMAEQRYVSRGGDAGTEVIALRTRLVAAVAEARYTGSRVAAGEGLWLEEGGREKKQLLRNCSPDAQAKT